MATTNKLLQAAAGVSSSAGGGGGGGGASGWTATISDASYDSVSFSVASQDTKPFSMAFNADGTKMFVLGIINKTIYQYTLSTAFDLSTSSYSSVSFSVNSQDTFPAGLAFNTDGTKMYVAGWTNDTIYQYTLSTGFDLSSASYANVSFNVNSQVTNPTGLSFNTDGTKMYISDFPGGNSGNLTEYTLSTASTVSSASYNNVQFSVTNEAPEPYGFSFNPAGTKVYVVMNYDDKVYQYSLATAFDLSSISYDSVSFSLLSEDTACIDIAFSNDGTKMYIVGNSTDSILQYSTGVTVSSGGGGGSSSGGLNIEDVYSINRYAGTSATQTITNGVDLSTHGGTVLTARSDVTNSGARSVLTDTTRGGDKEFDLGSSGAEATYNLSSFNTDGYTLSSGNYTQGNYSGYEYYSQTWRNADDFFAHGQYTGNGSTQTITHGLNGTVGMIWVKCSGNHWAFWHRGFAGTTSWNYLNLAYASGSSNTVFGNNSTHVDPTSTEFTVGSDGKVNSNGTTYTYYVWAHNDGSTHGDDSSQDMIKCGTYTGNGDRWNCTLIDLGFRPQSVWITPKSVAGKRYMDNSLTGMSNEYAYNQYDPVWFTDTYGGRVTNSMWVKQENTGFQLRNNLLNASGTEYLYMAVRRSNMGKPTDVTKVFKVDNVGESSPLPYYKSGFTTDMVITKSIAAYITDWLLSTRDWPTQAVKTNSNAIGANGPIAFAGWDNNEGVGTASLNASNNPGVAYLWKTARSFFDHHMYMGKGTGARTLNHDLQTIPEMLWLKKDTASNDWYVYHKDAHATAPEDYHLILNSDAAVTSSTIWDGTAPTASTIRVATSLNTNWGNYIMCCFGTAAGVSKVGGIAHTTGSNTVVDCGFSSGSSLVMLKRTDAAGGWLTYDSTRGIVSGNDSRLSLDSNALEVTNVDEIDPNSSGFEIGASLPTGNYIYYALA